VDGQKSTVSWRAIGVGAVLSLAIGALGSYCDTCQQGTRLTDDFSAPGALFMLFVVAVPINQTLLRVKRSWAFTAAELATIFAMVMVSAAVPTRGFVGFLTPTLTGARYYAAPENQWEQYILPYIPEWMILGDMDTIRWYYEGLPAGVPAPWQPWVSPLLFWLLFFIALSLVMIAIPVILRKQWMDHEKLAYPMMQPPLALVETALPSSDRPSLFRSRAFWIAFTISALIVSLNGLNHYYPNIHPMRLQATVRGSAFTGRLTFRVSPTVVGFAYFMNQSVALGMWVLFLLVNAQGATLQRFGVQFPRKLGIWSYWSLHALEASGAAAVLMLSMLYVSRQHLAAFIKAAIRPSRRGDGAGDDSGEIMSERGALVALILGFVFLVRWMQMAGLPLWASVLFLVIAGTFFIVITRTVIETGLPVVMTPALGSDFMVSAVGSQAIGQQGLVALGSTYVWHSEMRIYVMACCANALRVVHATTKKGRKRLSMALILGLLLSFAGAMVILMYFPYARGGMNLNRFNFTNVAQYPWMDASGRMRTPVKPTPGMALWFGVGAAAMTALLAARWLFVWWPIHPVAFLACFHWSGRVIWFSVFVAWLIKTFLLGFGGGKLYEKGRPFFLGLVLGEVVTAVLWIFIDMLTGARANPTTSFW